jgi:hypothetical protein
VVRMGWVRLSDWTLIIDDDQRVRVLVGWDDSVGMDPVLLVSPSL